MKKRKGLVKKIVSIKWQGSLARFGMEKFDSIIEKLQAPIGLIER